SASEEGASAVEVSAVSTAGGALPVGGVGSPAEAGASGAGAALGGGATWAPGGGPAVGINGGGWNQPPSSMMCRAANGNSATWRARLIARDNRRWCFAQVPVLRRGTVLPWLDM